MKGLTVNVQEAAHRGNSEHPPKWWREQLILAATLLSDEIEKHPAECVPRETLVAVAMLGRRRHALQGARQ